MKITIRVRYFLIIFLCLICSVFLKKETLADRIVPKPVCKLISGVSYEAKNDIAGSGFKYRYNQYKYDKYGNKIKYSNPFKNSLDEKITHKTDEMQSFFIKHETTRRMDFYDYNDKLVFWEKCYKPDFSDCENKKPVFKSYKDANGNKTDMYYSNDLKKIYAKYVYNSNGLKIEEFTTISANYTIIKYNYNNYNKIVEENKYYDNTLVSTKKYIYDKNQKLTEAFVSGGYNKEIYNTQGKIIKILDCESAFSQCNKMIKEFEYDNNNNLILERVYESRSPGDVAFVYKYEYDKYNNKTAKYSCNKYGILCRQIEKFKYECN